MRYLILAKRVLKKPGLLICLLIMPVAALLVTLIAAGGTQTMSIALVCPGESRKAADRLTETGSVVSFTVFESEEAALAQVRSGRADAAWILPEDLSERALAFAGGDRQPFIKVYRGAKRVTDLIASEKLFAAIYPELSYAVYSDSAAGLLSAGEEDGLRDAFDNALNFENIVTVETSAGGAPAGTDPVRAALRGFLATCCLLCALCGGVFALSDHAEGRFDGLSPAKKPLFFAVTVFWCALFSVAVMLVCLWIFGLADGSLFTELAAALILVLDCWGFVMLLSLIAFEPGRLCALAPPVLLAALALSPVFLEPGALRTAAKLMPVTAYLDGTVSPAALAQGVVYAAVTVLAALALGRLRLSKAE